MPTLFLTKIKGIHSDEIFISFFQCELANKFLLIRNVFRLIKKKFRSIKKLKRVISDMSEEERKELKDIIDGKN